MLDSIIPEISITRNIISENVISEYIISGICTINRNLTHHAIPYIKNNIVPEVYELGHMIVQIMNTVKHVQQSSIY